MSNVAIWFTQICISFVFVFVFVFVYANLLDTGLAELNKLVHVSKVVLRPVLDGPAQILYNDNTEDLQKQLMAEQDISDDDEDSDRDEGEKNQSDSIPDDDDVIQQRLLAEHEFSSDEDEE